MAAAEPRMRTGPRNSWRQSGTLSDPHECGCEPRSCDSGGTSTECPNRLIRELVLRQLWREGTGASSVVKLFLQTPPHSLLAWRQGHQGNSFPPPLALLRMRTDQGDPPRRPLEGGRASATSGATETLARAFSRVSVATTSSQMESRSRAPSMKTPWTQAAVTLLAP